MEERLRQKRRVLPKRTPPQEGLRARKKDETRRRIAEAAMALFRSRGFEATTLDDIAKAAHVSKRSFFDYFPSKEDVVFAWQDQFRTELVTEVAARPRTETHIVAAERAFIAALGRYDLADAMSHARLMHDAPALRARDHLKYEALERDLGDALMKRSNGARDELRIRLIAMLMIGALRTTSAYSYAHGATESPATLAKRVVRLLKAELQYLA